MVGRFVENQKIGTREQRPAKRDAAFFPAGKRVHDTIGFRSVQIRDERLDPVFQIPTIGLADLVEERGAERAVARDAFVFGDEVENPLRAAENVRMDRGRIVQAGKLWHEPVTRSRRHVNSPESARATPAAIWRNVDLPEPLRPTSPMCSPSLKAIVAPLRAT